MNKFIQRILSLKLHLLEWNGFCMIFLEFRLEPFSLIDTAIILSNESNGLKYLHKWTTHKFHCIFERLITKNLRYQQIV